MPQPGRERTQRTRSRSVREARGNSPRHYFQHFRRGMDIFQNKLKVWPLHVNEVVSHTYAYSLVCVYSSFSDTSHDNKKIMEFPFQVKSSTSTTSCDELQSSGRKKVPPLPLKLNLPVSECKWSVIVINPTWMEPHWIWPFEYLRSTAKAGNWPKGFRT